MNHLLARPVLTLLIFCALIFSITSATRAAQDLSGTYAGTLDTNAGPGDMELTLARDGENWKASAKFHLMGQAVPASNMKDLKITGAEISFTANVIGAEVKFNGKFIGEGVGGKLEAFESGKMVGNGAWTLKRSGGKPGDAPKTTSTTTTETPATSSTAATPAAAVSQPKVQQGGSSNVGGQMADPSFDAKVAHPAYTSKHPSVLFDEAHNNFHTSAGRYKPFADLMTNDGFQIKPNREKFTAQSLKGYDILLISNALGAEEMDDAGADSPAFTEAEADAVRDWVNGGGSLLLIADHAPMGAAAENLAKRFDVEMSKGFTADPQNFDKESGNQSFIVYTREGASQLAVHPITEGRDASEKVKRVIAFTGQSLKGPKDSVAFMKLSETAADAYRPTDPTTPRKLVPATGRAQGLAMKFGKGRVVVLGEAGMLSAQVVGQDRKPFGMNRTDIDNRQLALNIMHWLSGLLK